MIVHVLINDGFVGDNHQVQAIGAELETRNFSKEMVFLTRSDNDPNIAQQLASDWKTTEQAVLVISGKHGLELLANPEVREIIGKKKPTIIWVGHQDPGLATVKDELSVVALPQHILDQKPELQAEWNNRVVAMEAVPNTLSPQELLLAVSEWDASHPDATIPKAKQGYLGVFLGGDAPEPDNVHHYWSEENARQLGMKFGELAQAEGKLLLVTNGPRCGKFYPDSPDPKNPVVRQSIDGCWRALTDLSQEDKKNSNPVGKPHAVGSPMDPVSVAFLEGVKASGIGDDQYRFFDFQFGHSAYKAIVAAIFSQQQQSVVFYSGESISYAELSYLIPQTFAFFVDSMNAGHQAALDRFSRLGMIGVFDFTKAFDKQRLDEKNKLPFMQAGAKGDAKRIVDTLLALVPTLTDAPQPLRFQAPAKDPSRQDKQSSTATMVPKSSGLGY